MPEITFVFGPRSTFFFDCPKTWKFHGIPQTLRQLFNSSTGPQWRIVQPYCVALAPAVNSLEPIWYVGCRTLSGGDKLFHTQTHFEHTYADLARWINSIPSAPSSCFVTFGTDLSYFASARGQGSIWGGLPSDLEETIRKTPEAPCCVALGAKRAWFIMYPDGQIAWKFHGYYGGLNKILTTAAPNTVSYVALSPYHKEHYFIAFTNKSIQYNFTGAPSEWMKLMTEVFDAWAAERLQKQAQPFQPPTSPPYYLPGQHLPQQLPYYPGQPYFPVQAYGGPPQYPQAQPMYTPSQPQTPNSPLPLYTGPMSQSTSPVVAAFNVPPLAAVELPAELPGEIMVSTPAPVPVRSVSDVSSSHVSLAKELWG